MPHDTGDMTIRGPSGLRDRRGSARAITALRFPRLCVPCRPVIGCYCSSPLMAETDPYGTKALPELYKEWAAVGMVANIGTRLVEVKAGSLVLEGNMTEQAHGFPTSRGMIVHGA